MNEQALSCDLLVIGSGAGGLAAAVTAAWHGLKVIVAEKAPVLGGATVRPVYRVTEAGYRLLATERAAREARAVQS